jgi:hypothetical protein
MIGYLRLLRLAFFVAGLLVIRDLYRGLICSISGI